LRGGVGGINGPTSGGGMGQMINESFDLDIMMPPDVASIDSDISKIIYIKIFRQIKCPDSYTNAKQQ